jgi:hypothetical protein
MLMLYLENSISFSGKLDTSLTAAHLLLLHAVPDEIHTCTYRIKKNERMLPAGSPPNTTGKQNVLHLLFSPSVSLQVNNIKSKHVTESKYK